MAYTLLFDLDLGAPGIADARAQLIDTNGNNSGAASSAGFIDSGSGFYLWIGTIPDGFTGGVKFYSAASPSIVLAFKAINLPVWSEPVRTLTQSVTTGSETVAGNTLALVRGDTLSISLTGLGDLSSYVSLDFTIKNETSDTDAQAIVRIRKNLSGTNDGLLTLNASPATDPTAGSLTIDDGTLGNISIALDAPEAAALAPNWYVYDVQMITATDVVTLISGSAFVSPDVTRAVT
jgi:hypothetical protein